MIDINENQLLTFICGIRIGIACTNQNQMKSRSKVVQRAEKSNFRLLIMLILYEACFNFLFKLSFSNNGWYQCLTSLGCVIKLIRHRTLQQSQARSAVGGNNYPRFRECQKNLRFHRPNKRLQRRTN